MSKIIELSALELRDAIATGEVSATEATRSYLDAIESLNPKICAYNQVFTEEALQRAEQIDKKRSAGEQLGLLAGLPLAIKDNICTSFGLTTCSSRILDNFRSPYDATVVEKLIEADAIILGKTNMDEFAMGSSTENSAFGITRNPWDTSRVPGGSSGGSAAAVAGRMCVAALGSDTGGSIRQPAAFCGVVGLKPTYGRVSRYGLVAYGSSLDQIGPITRDVKDAALLLEVIAGHDARDSTSVDEPVPNYLAALDDSINKRLRVGIVKEFQHDSIDQEVIDALEKAIEIFDKAGAEIIEVSLPHSRIDIDSAGRITSYAIACYYLIATSEASSNLARYDGVHYGRRTSQKVNDIIELYSKTRAEGFGDEVKRRIMLGTYALSAGYYDAYYLKALKVRRLIKNDFDAAFEKCDVLLCPTAPELAFPIGQKTDDPLKMYLSDVFTIGANLAGIPGISIPVGLSKSNLPLAVQLLANVFDEQTLLQAARVLEQTIGLGQLKPELIEDA
ncbi:MAG: Asp-tRNA(Asn)/Glu-tRNA(Gln) amidotransferase subunit GatA [Planctomycetes bacterium]|nr:Asp-tRNA(Asn)/Glu-tRNA(Gln) amidotransferase subunit GatA [Planctomycetota bacterium]